MDVVCKAVDREFEVIVARDVLQAGEGGGLEIGSWMG